MDIAKRKEFDKFYTNPEITKRFVNKVDSVLGFDNYDLIIEPAAGSGSIYQYLPESKRLGMDIYPELDGIIKQSFYDYGNNLEPYLNELMHDKKILTITNPPFGSGYMNPEACKFFNHAASFSESIAMIIPAKWHSSWKVQRQLDRRFGLYYSNILPKDSFMLGDDKYHVNCSEQIWSVNNHGENLRIKNRPPTTHEDFDVFLTCDNVPGRPAAMHKLKNAVYWEFGIKYWGNIKIDEVPDIKHDTTTHFLIKCNTPDCRNVFENIIWSDYVYNMGAPNIGGKSVLVNAYIETKNKLNKIANIIDK